MWVSLPTIYWSAVVQPPPLTCANYAAPLYQTKKAIFFCLLAVAFLPVTVCVLSLSLSLSIPHGMHLVVPTHPYFFWVTCHPSRTFPPKEPEQEPQDRFFSSPHCQIMPSYLWPMTSPCPVLAGYRLVIYGPCTCFTFMYVYNLSAVHAFTVVWRLVCTVCRSSLTSYGVSYFLMSHSLMACSP